VQSLTMLLGLLKKSEVKPAYMSLPSSFAAVLFTNIQYLIVILAFV
jgi:hypothetical protein